MKIAYCIPGVYNSGGMEKVLSTKANYLVNHDYEVAIITTDQRGLDTFFHFDSKIKFFDLGINYELNSTSNFLKKVIVHTQKLAQHRKALTQLLIKERFDVVISMYGLELSILPSIPDGSIKIVEVHFSKFKRIQYGRKGIWKLSDQFRSKCDEYHLKRYDHFVVLTEEDKSYWGNFANISVIPNPLEKYPTEQADLNSHTISAIGRLDHQKNFEDLIDIWTTIEQQHPDWQLNIYGKGALYHQLQQKINTLKLQRIRLQTPTNHIETVYLNSSIIAMTSRYEGLPMVLMEAQSYGIPIVSYDCKCGPKDIVRNGKSGFVVPLQDTQTFALRLQELMNNKELRTQMGAIASKDSERYRIQPIMDKWIQLFNTKR